MRTWCARVRERPVTQCAYARAAKIKTAPVVDDAAKRILFDQDAAIVP